MSARWTGVAVVAAFAAGSGCGGKSRGEPVRAPGPTLEIVNSSSLVYRVTVHPGLVVQVHPGQRKCVQAGSFSETRTMEVLALASSETHYTPPENLMTSPGWILELGQRPRYDVLTLRPAERCKA